eukprot:3313968-Rhodomonas_salina.1
MPLHPSPFTLYRPLFMLHASRLTPHASGVWGYAVCGSAVSYGATRCAVVPYRMALRDVRYCRIVWGYAMSGTEIAYFLWGSAERTPCP